MKTELEKNTRENPFKAESSDISYLKSELSKIGASKKAKIKIEFECSSCGSKKIVSANTFLSHPFLCRTCQTNLTLIEKYGSVEAGHKVIQQAVEQNNLKKYGCKNAFQRKDVKDKIEKSNIEKHGVKCCLSIKEIHDKGIEQAHSIEAEKKRKKTLKEKYGINNAFQLAEHRDFSKSEEKRKKTAEKKYGSEEAYRRHIVSKTKETNLRKYGVESYTQTSEYQSKSKKAYKYNNLSFDSSWEVAFYIFYSDMGFNVERCPISFDYIDEDNTKRKYFPDFRVEDRLFEIKGSQFFKDGKMINPYSGKITECKRRCALENNVSFITEVEIKPMIAYVCKKYGKNFLRNLKNE